MTQTNTSHDLTRSTLYILWIGILIAGTFWIIQPFVAPLLWAAMTVVSTWPAMLRLQRWLRGSRRLAVVVMTLLLLLVLIIPLTLALGTIFVNADRIVDWAKGVQTLTVPPPPAWVANLPFGGKIVDVWQDLAARGAGDLIGYAKPYTPRVVGWFIEKAGSAGMLLVQFLLTVIIAAVLYTHGETAAGGIRRFARRLGGIEGEDVVILAGRAVRGVALGVVVTALLQSVLGGLGLAVAGLPAAPLLTAVMLILCLAQLGPLPVLLAAVAWLFWSGSTFAAIALLVWTIPVGTIDNFVRPVLIKKGANLPLLLVFAGVLGGLASMGIVGIFVGPTVLAVSYTMLRSWVDGDGQKAEPQE
jgi:predicted PurR-regulated permease PerM